MSTLYEQDFYSWTQQQAEILRRGGELRLNAPAGIDWANLAEEIWELGLSLENELYHRYVVLLAHLLKWRWQPKWRGGSWRATIGEQRYRIARLLRKNPSLKPKRLAEFADAYEEAVNRAAGETELPIETFPATCPFTLEQVEDQGFWPEPKEERS
jgi:hypothetical protein